MTENAPGLRELRKRQTRQSISDTATRLFLERGFEEVTIAEVAAAAGVAKMTVTNYFPRKEDLLFDMQEEFTGSLARVVQDRPSGASALAALREDFLARVAEHDPVLGFTGQRFATLIADSPALTGRLREFHDLREAALAEALAAETADDTVVASAAAAQLASVLRVLFNEIKRRNLNGEEPDAIAEAVREDAVRAFARLERGLADYAVRG